MREIVDAILKDCSTREVFSFSVRCAECGEVWKSRQIRFSKAGVSPLSEGKRIVFDTLYQKEHERARNAAMSQSHLQRTPASSQEPETVPQQVREMYRRFDPGISDEEIAKDYKKRK